MKLSYLLLATAATLLATDYAAEGQLWWSHIEFLADDKLAGRNVGTEGFQQAAAYVAGRFDKIGLKPAGAAGYLQTVKFETRTLVSGQTKLALLRDGAEQPLAIGRDAALAPRGSLNGSMEAEVVFVGYGMSIPGTTWNDLAGQDLKGKIAAYVNVPAPAAVSDNVKSHFSSAGERWALLQKAGAIGVAVLPDPRPGSTNTPPAATAFGLADPALQEVPPQVLAAIFTRAGAEKLLAGSGHDLAELERLVLSNQPLPRFQLPGTLRASAAVQTSTVESANVAGVLPGSDPQLKDEYVIMSAHLDHLGVGRAVNGDNIYNGAMDDASGVASVIEIARVLKESGVKLKRSILFLTVTGEEKGLLGSRYFAARPLVGSGTVVADINLDMFLPLFPLKVIEVQGLTESTLGEQVTAAARELGVEVQTDREPEQNRFIRSDQYSFIRSGIPALAFKFGYEFGSEDEKTRKDWVRDRYHKPSDDVSQPVDRAAAAKFNRVILGLLQRVADDPARPRWKDDSFFKRFAK